MIIRPPREPKIVSWLLVVLWSAFIFYTITAALDIRDKVDGEYGKNFVKYFVMGMAAVGAVWSVIIIVVNRARYNWFNYVALTALLGLYVYSVNYIYKSPEHSRWESMHFVQYGVLAVFMFRAVAQSLHDWGAFVVALVLTIIHGAIDETVQWAHVDRYWDFGDLVLNGYSASLALLMIALGLKPAYFSGLTRKSSSVALSSLSLFLIYLGMCCANTAAWTPWFEKHFPYVAEGSALDGPMAEYGYLYDDAAINVVFKSRLSPQELKATDEKRGAEAAMVLPSQKAQTLNSDAYKKFLIDYNPSNDPWLHELRVHLYSRDKNEQRVREQIAEPKDDYPDKAASMIHEDRILQKYYPTFYEAYDLALDPGFAEEVKGKMREGTYHSRVSRNLITHTNLQEILIWIGSMLLLCMVTNIITGLWGKPTFVDPDAIA